MVTIPKWRRYLRFWRSDPEGDVDDELRTHFELRIAELRRGGLAAADAERLAIEEFGDIEATRRRLYEIGHRSARRQARFLWWDALRADLRYALRGLRASPVLTAGVVLTLGLGIGASTAMYGLMYRLLLQPPPHVVAPEAIVRIFFHYEFTDRPGRTTDRSSYPFYEHLRAGTRALGSVAAYAEHEISVGAGPDAGMSRAVYASDGFWRTLGVRPAHGRTFTDEEAHPVTGARVAVLSHRYWQRRFGSDPAAVGATLHLKGQPYRVIGVVPPGFRGVGLEDAELWLPLFAYADGDPLEQQWYTYAGDSRLTLVGRLAPGVTRAAADAELSRLYTAFASAERERFARSTRVREDGPRTRAIAAPLQSAVGSDMQRLPMATVAVWLVGVAGVLLAIAVANVASLLLLRALRRRREIAVRIALGMTRQRLAALLFTESALLAMLGGAAALLVVGAGGPVANAVLLPDLHIAPAMVDGRLLLVSAFGVIGAALVAGLVPVLQTRSATAAALKDGAQHGSARRSPLHWTLLVTQTALSVALLVGAGLFLRSLQRVAALDLGLDVEQALAVSVNFDGTGRKEREVAAFYERARERVATLPGVDRTSLALSTPLRWARSGNIRLPGSDERLRSEEGSPSVNYVSDGFFETTGTGVLQGRGFMPADATGPPVVVVNAALARFAWPGRSPVGECVHVSGVEGCATVVGVVETARKFRLQEPEALLFYRPLRRGESGAEVLLVRQAPGAQRLETTVRRALLELEPGLPYVEVSTLGSALNPQLRPWRLGAKVFTGFGLLAALLAALGLFAAVAYAVTQRTREIGVRMAVGATARDVTELVLRDALRIAVAGVAIGLLGALVGGRWLADLLFETSPHDVVVLATVAVVLLGVALTAGLVPARRATRVNPTAALRLD